MAGEMETDQRDQSQCFNLKKSEDKCEGKPRYDKLSFRSLILSYPDELLWIVIYLFFPLDSTMHFDKRMKKKEEKGRGTG